MHEKHIDQLSLPQARWSKCWKDRGGGGQHENKEQGKTQHETPRTKNLKAIQK